MYGHGPGNVHICMCVHGVLIHMYIYARRQWRNGVNGQSATYQLGNQWYRLPARSNVRHAVDGAVERIVARMSGTEKISEAASALVCDHVRLSFQQFVLILRFYIFLSLLLIFIIVLLVFVILCYYIVMLKLYMYMLLELCFANIIFRCEYYEF